MELLNDLTIYRGAHAAASGQRCIMEMVAYLANEPHSDHPACASEVLTGYAMAINDRMPDDKRQELLPMAFMLTATNQPEYEQERQEFIVRQTVLRIVAPLFLKKGYAQHAKAMAEAATSKQLPDVAKACHTAATAGVASASNASADAVYAAYATADAASAAYAAVAAHDAYGAGADAWDEAIGILRDAIEIGNPHPSEEAKERAEANAIPVS